MRKQHAKGLRNCNCAAIDDLLAGWLAAGCWFGCVRELVRTLIILLRRQRLG
jgi:hypothetical protein